MAMAGWRRRMAAGSMVWTRAIVFEIGDMLYSLNVGIIASHIIAV